MKARLIIFGVIVLGCVAFSAAADTVLLANEGRVEGSVDAVVITSEGKSRTIRRGEFSGILLSDHGLDVVKLEGDATASGRVESIQMKSVGGILTFKREELRTIAVVPGKMDETRKEYFKKRAAVKDNDAVGLYELADWCKRNALLPEAYNLARLSLKADPNLKVADSAHQLLGHVLVDGEWKEPPPPAVGSTTAPATATVPAEPPPATINPETLELHKRLCDEYSNKAKELAQKDREAVKNAYQKDFETFQAKLKQCKNEIDNLDRRRIDLSEQIRVERDVARRQGLQNDYNSTRQAYSTQKRLYERTYASWLALADKIRSAQDVAASRAQARAGRVDVARLKIERLLRLGRQLSEADMRAIFDAALND